MGMNKTFTIASCALLAAAAAGGAVHNIDREAVSVYVYRRTLDAYVGEYGELAAQMRREENVGAVFLSVSMIHLPEPDYAQMVRDFVSAVHGQNIFVHAMYLQDETSLDDLDVARTRTQEIINFHNQSGPGEQFDGFTIDVEPERTSDWDDVDKRFGLVKKLLSVMEAIRGVMAANGCDEPFSASLWAHYMKDGTLRPYLTYNGESVGYPDDFLQWADFVILMSYDDDSSDIVEAVEDEIESAGRNDSVMVGVATKEGDSDDTTFWEEGWQALCSAMGEVRVSFDFYTGPLLGFVVFEYESYNILKTATPPWTMINFQPITSVPPPDCLKDSGLSYGMMGGYHYGWR